MYACMYVCECMYDFLSVCMDGWMDGWMLACMHACMLMYVRMVVDLNSFICKGPFLANKDNTFANLSRTPHSSFAGVSH